MIFYVMVSYHKNLISHRLKCLGIPEYYYLQTFHASQFSVVGKVKGIISSLK